MRLTRSWLILINLKNRHFDDWIFRLWAHIHLKFKFGELLGALPPTPCVYGPAISMAPIIIQSLVWFSCNTDHQIGIVVLDCLHTKVGAKILNDGCSFELIFKKRFFSCLLHEVIWAHNYWRKKFPTPVLLFSTLLIMRLEEIATVFLLPASALLYAYVHHACP